MVCAIGARLLAVWMALAVGVAGAEAAERQVPASAADMQLSFAPVVKQVAPAVVNVYASRTVAQQVSPFFSDGWCPYIVYLSSAIYLTIRESIDRNIDINWTG